MFIKEGERVLKYESYLDELFATYKEKANNVKKRVYDKIMCEVIGNREFYRLDFNDFMDYLYERYEYLPRPRDFRYILETFLNRQNVKHNSKDPLDMAARVVGYDENGNAILKPLREILEEDRKAGKEKIEQIKKELGKDDITLNDIWEYFYGEPFKEDFEEIDIDEIPF